MAYEDITLLLGGWEGFELVGATRDVSVAPPVITLTLQAVADAAKHCSECGALVTAVHDVSERRVRELPIMEATT